MYSISCNCSANRILNVTKLLSNPKFEDWLFNNIFKPIYCDKNNLMKFNDQNVLPRYDPSTNSRHDTFYHIACGGEKMEWQVDRIEKYKWSRNIIENCLCDNSLHIDCMGPKIYKIKKRYHIYIEEINYIVVIEEKTGYYYLITGYPITYAHEKKKILNNWQKNKVITEQKAPSLLI